MRRAESGGGGRAHPSRQAPLAACQYCACACARMRPIDVLRKSVFCWGRSSSSRPVLLPLPPSRPRRLEEACPVKVKPDSKLAVATAKVKLTCLSFILFPDIPPCLALQSKIRAHSYLFTLHLGATSTDVDAITFQWLTQCGYSHPALPSGSSPAAVCIRLTEFLTQSSVSSPLPHLWALPQRGTPTTATAV